MPTKKETPERTVRKLTRTLMRRNLKNGVAFGSAKGFPPDKSAILAWSQPSRYPSRHKEG